VLLVSETAPLEKIPPPLAKLPVVLFPETVLLVSVAVEERIPPPSALLPAVLFPLTVLSVSMRARLE